MRKLILFLFALSLVPSAHAVELRGDWESAGDAPRPYEPKYEFEYNCQMELKGKKPLVAVTQFTLRNKETFFETKKQTHWDWVKIDRDGEPTDAASDPGLQREGYFVSLRLRPPTEEGAKDRVYLSLGWKLSWRDVVFGGSQYQFEFTRENTYLRGRFYLDVSKPKASENRKEVSAQVYCEKVK